MKENPMERLRELTEKLREAAYYYYQQDMEIMSNYEYDALYDELQALEKESGTVLSGSPTQMVGYTVQSSLPKVMHERPMLSLDKTKSREALQEWIAEQKGLLSWKMDGLTVVLRYQDGELVQAVTRGNGIEGEEITANARTFRNVPLRIPYKGELVLRGEAVMSYTAFEKVNEGLKAEEQYKNPRNLCSGTVRQLDSSITARRGVHFLAFGLVAVGEDVDFEDSKMKQMLFLQKQGFTIVDTKVVTKDTILGSIAEFEEAVAMQEYPSDGLVLTLDSISYSESLGQTAKFPRDSMAFKWQDETAVTHLMEIEWNTSRTGLINPVAIFEPVELEGTTVQRASLHNVSILQELKLGIGDQIEVYKANMIIPQIASNLTQSDTYKVPDRCPRCGGEAVITANGDTKVLMCTNPSCPAKLLKAFTHFVSRDAMNIEGLSEATLERFIEMNLLQRFGDLYRLSEHKDVLMQLDGFGEKSVEKLLQSIEQSRDTELYRVVNALGILNIGTASAKLLCRHFDEEMDRIRTADAEEIAGIEGFGEITAHSVAAYFATESNAQMLDDLMQYMKLAKEETLEERRLEGLQFVITGSLEHFGNRKELQDLIEKHGGKAASSVSAKTDYLINNNVQSTSSKNKKARELGIPILTEDDFLKLIHGQNA